MRNRRFELHAEWDDGCTVEIRYFERRKDADEYLRRHGLSKYVLIDKWKTEKHTQRNEGNGDISQRNGIQGRD